MTTHLLDPNEVRPFDVSFASRLVSGETVASATVDAPLGITVAPTGHPTVVGTNKVTVTLTGGTDGVTYRIVVRATTSAGRVYDEALKVRALDRSSSSSAAPPADAATVDYVTQVELDALDAAKLSTTAAANTYASKVDPAGVNFAGPLTVNGAPVGGVSPDATTTTNGLVRLAGDLAGTAAVPTVPGLAGKLDQAAGDARYRLLSTPLPASKFRDDIQAYNITGSSLRSWNFAYAKARNGEGRAAISLYGDSVTSGYRSSSPQYTNSWPARTRALIEARTGVATGTGFVKAVALTEDTGENRMAFTGTWANRGSGFFPSQDRYNAAGGTLTLGPITTDRFRLYYTKYSGAGTATVTIDGGAVASINSNQASGFTVAFTDYAVTQGSHTLVLTAPTGSDFILIGWEARLNGSTTGIRIDNTGHNGQTASALKTVLDGSLTATSAQIAWDLLDPDLAVICFGLNELNNSIVTATYKAEVLRLVQRAKALPASVVLLTPPPPAAVNDPAGRYAAYVGALYEIADAEDVALIDVSKRWKDYTTSNAAGLMFDGQHPNSRGYYDLANLVSTALLNVAII